MKQTGGTNAGSNSYTKQSTSCYTFSLNERSGCITNNDDFNNTYSTYTISLGYARSRIYYIEKSIRVHIIWLHFHIRFTN